MEMVEKVFNRKIKRTSDIDKKSFWNAPIAMVLAENY